MGKAPRSIDDFLIDRIFEPIVLRAAGYGRTAPWIAGNVAGAAIVICAFQLYLALPLFIEHPPIFFLLFLSAPGLVFVNWHRYGLLRRLHEAAVRLRRPIASPLRPSPLGRFDRAFLPATAAFDLFCAAIYTNGEKSLFIILVFEAAKMATLGIAAFFAACTVWPPEPPARRREAGARALAEGAPS